MINNFVASLGSMIQIQYMKQQCYEQTIENQNVNKNYMNFILNILQCVIISIRWFIRVYYIPIFIHALYESEILQQETQQI
ncbi:hypothetical protein pb186bvf_007112 [Paramecium bursaria]